MVLSIEQIIFAKRQAMNYCFWNACGYDDDYGYDRLMRMENDADMKTEDWGAVYLHQHLQGNGIENIQRFVETNAVSLLTVLVGVTQDVARSALQKYATTETQNRAGFFTNVA